MIRRLALLGLLTAVSANALEMPTEVRTIQGAVAVPDGFDRVARIDYGEAGIRLVAASGVAVDVPVRHAFVMHHGSAAR